jgi:hypothetical protein
MRKSIIAAVAALAAIPFAGITPAAHADTCSALFPLTGSWQYQQCEKNIPSPPADCGTGPGERPCNTNRCVAEQPGTDSKGNATTIYFPPGCDPSLP